MDRFKVVVEGPRKYVVQDLKHGQEDIAWFFTFDLCQQFITYMNQKEALINLIYKQVNDEFDKDFKD